MSTYVRTGRGGAGNMIPQHGLQQKKLEDLEAGTAANRLSQQQLAAPPAQAGIWRHMGRGGAGNWYTPSELPTQGTFTNTHDPTEEEPATSSEQRPWRGRGGAGNFVPEQPVEPEQIELQERAKAKEIEEGIRRQVDGDGEGALRRPEGAYLVPDKD